MSANENLKLLYDNKQQWVRHYETLLAQITPLSTTFGLALVAYIAEGKASGSLGRILMLVPLVISIFNVWFNWWCDSEIKRQFHQIIIAERGMGFYEITVDGEKVLPDIYKNSSATTRPIVIAGFCLQAVTFILIAIVFFGVN